ncbi:MAG: nodulation protein NfeD [Candidatus Korarchaeum sp.]|nr:nodulation protein NfeD [Candidatus Korarchaeum sp.]MDW8034913.1 nodulation protein NfeD [Candidatus Korarchaeum sp.]
MRGASLLIPLIFFALLIPLLPNNAGSRILVTNVTGYISPATVEQIKLAVATAEGGYNALVLQINTFGGQADATFSIIEVLLSSKVPVIGYVYPQGSQALSAGTYIMLATDYAAMSPYSTIGSAQPVVGYTPLNESKYLNAYSAKMRSYAAMHGRNETAAELLVKSNINLMAEEALKVNLIEAVEPSLDSLLQRANGKVVKRGNITFKLETYPASVEYLPMSPRVEIMKYLSDPLLSSILFSIGFMMLIVGISSPGWGAELAGIVLILLAVIGMGVNVDLVSLILLAIAASLFIAEIKKGLHGLGALSSTALLVLAILLMVGSPWRPTLVPFSWMIDTLLRLIISVGSVGLIISLIFVKAIASVLRRGPVSWIPAGKGIAVEGIPPGGTGYIRISGELWRATSEEEIKEGDRVEVIGRKDNLLVIRKVR